MRSAEFSLAVLWAQLITPVDPILFMHKLDGLMMDEAERHLPGCQSDSFDATHLISWLGFVSGQSILVKSTFSKLFITYLIGPGSGGAMYCNLSHDTI